MTMLSWGVSEQKSYISGVDRVVVYPSSGPPEVWNGVTSIEHDFSSGTLNSFYCDGIKYMDKALSEDYRAKISAFMYPDSIARSDGTEWYNVRLKKSFGLTYRTRVITPNDSDSRYILHLVYNVTAEVNDKAYSSINSTASTTGFGWDLSATPVPSFRSKPTAYLTLDSLAVPSYRLHLLEDYLYGSSDSDPYLPTPTEIAGVFNLTFSGYGHGPYGHGPYGHGPNRRV